jgi:hypothetical protein
MLVNSAEKRENIRLRAGHDPEDLPSPKAKPDDVFGQRQKVETAAGRRGDLADAKFL